MQSIELTKPLTTESLLAEFESRFNQTMDLSKFTKEELEDTANHVRTKIHEITQNTHFGQELKDDSYQKNQMMLDIINQAITERKLAEYSDNPVLDKATAPIKDKLKKGQALSPDEREAASKLMASKTNEVAPLMALGRVAAKSAGAAAGTAVANRAMDKLGMKEGVEEQSELILAAKDMMDKVTGYLEDLASVSYTHLTLPTKRIV